jgi:hypothetical protein
VEIPSILTHFRFSPACSGWYPIDHGE